MENKRKGRPENDYCGNLVSYLILDHALILPFQFAFQIDYESDHYKLNKLHSFIKCQRSGRRELSILRRKKIELGKRINMLNEELIQRNIEKDSLEERIAALVYREGEYEQEIREIERYCESELKKANVSIRKGFTD